MTDRVDAIVTHPLVVPISIEDPRLIKSGLKVRLDDGRHVPARAYFIWASSTGDSSEWTKATPRWNLIGVHRYTKAEPDENGTWIAIIDLPIDAVGQGIWIDEIRYEPNWLPSPMRVILETSSRTHDGFWEPALTDQQRRSGLIQTAINNLRADPFNRWRAELMAEGFSPDRKAGSNPAHSDRDLSAIHTELLQSNASRVLDQIAEHFSARWQIILGRIWLIDPSVASRLKRQLTQTADAQGIMVPLWTDDTAQLSALAHDLLSPFVNDELRVERVVAWLDAQPQSMSWIIDDAGHPSRFPLRLSPTIGLLGLITDTSSPQNQLARIESNGIESNVHILEPGRFTQITVPTPTNAVLGKAMIDQPRTINVQIGRDRSGLNSIGNIPIATPPGVLVGPLLSDWTLEAFGSRRSGSGALPPTNFRVAGMVHRVSALNESDPDAGWRLYLECAIDLTAQAAPAAPDTTIGIWIGPKDSTRIAWTISRKLGLVELRADPDLTADPSFTSVIDGDRWMIELNIPPHAISEDGFLILGLNRIDGSLKSSWPRRMMPWQTEPGRYVIDTTGWNASNQTPQAPQAPQTHQTP